MNRIRYDVINRKGGWCIASGAVVGPPYNRKIEALRDAVAVGEFLERFGDDVDVYVEQRDGLMARIQPVEVGAYLSERKPPAGQVS